jgi:hypothetical protein
MMAKQYGNFTDFLSITRASYGTALRKVKFGPNLVTNGQFRRSVDGWTCADGTIASVGGQMEITYTATTQWTYASIPTKAGKVYRYTAYARSDNAVNWRIQAEDSVFGGTLLGQTTEVALTPDLVMMTVNFVALSDTTVIEVFTRLTSGTAYVDNVTVEECLLDHKDGELILFNHPDNVARVEYDEFGRNKGVLVEESRTNLVTDSTPSEGDWSESVVTGSVTWEGTAQGPDGVTNSATTVTFDTGGTASGDRAIISDAYTTVVSTDYAHSVWLRGHQGGEKLMLRGAGTVAYQLITLTREWVRYDWQETAATTSPSFEIGIRQQVSGHPIVNTVAKVDIYGAQAEAGAFPTSYIPTSGSTATRAADIMSIDVDQFGYNQQAGSVVVEYSSVGSDGSDYPHAMSLVGASSSDTARVGYNQSNLNQFVVSTSSGGNQAVLNNGTYTPDAAITMAGGFRKDDFASSLDGAAVVTDTAGDMPTNIESMTIGLWFTGNYLNGHIKSLKYIPRRLTNDQLEAQSA